MRALPKVPRRIKQVTHKFLYSKRLTSRERRRLVRFLQAQRREPIRRLPDGRISVLDLP